MVRLALAFVLALAPRLAAAQPADPSPDALLDEGRRLFTDEDDFEGARDLFLRSYDARPSWQALNGIALTWQKQARWVRALETYERLRAEFGPELAGKQLDTVDRRITDLGKRIAILVLHVADPGAAISVDGDAIGQGPYQGSIRLDPGGHLVAVSLADHRPFTERVTLTPGDTTTLSIDLVPVAVKVVVVPPPPISTRRRFATWIPWATLAGGVGLIAAGGLLDVAAERDFDRFDDLVAGASGSMPAPMTVNDGALRSGERKRSIATGLYVAGGLAAAAGTVLYFVNRPRPVETAPARVSLAVGPGSAQLRIRF